MRRATSEFHRQPSPVNISIHALHEESDFMRSRHVHHLIKISIHALHEESDLPRHRYRGSAPISIHALHEESDATHTPQCSRTYISIHALHEESDVVALLARCNCCKFQSTLSMRRATTSLSPYTSMQSTFQSTLSMRRATGQATGLDTMTVFQSTLSMRRATRPSHATRPFQDNFNPRSP